MGLKGLGRSRTDFTFLARARLIVLHLPQLFWGDRRWREPGIMTDYQATVFRLPTLRKSPGDLAPASLAW